MAYLNRHQFRTYYHGTNSRYVENIKKEGLKTHLPGSEEEWYDINNPEPGHPKGVYLTENIDTARNYGDAVFSVELPDSANWGWTEGEGSVLLHDIHPYMLKQVE